MSKNGRQVAELNVNKLLMAIEHIDKLAGWAAYVDGLKINRSKLAKQCHFDRKVFITNPGAKRILCELEQRVIGPDSIFKMAPLTRDKSNGGRSDSAGITLNPTSGCADELAHLSQCIYALLTLNAAVAAKLRNLEHIERHFVECGICLIW